MPLVKTRGAASAQGFGEFAQVTAANYIEEVFSTYLYTGNGSTQTITNGIDLSTKGGLTWTKSRTTVDGHGLVDTARGGTQLLQSQSTGSQSALAATTFYTTGYDLGNAQGRLNGSGTNYVSWTFREQPKFFDIVTWTGDGTGDREISHNLGSAPGCIILKSTSTGGTNWFVYHRALSTPDYRYIYLNDTLAANTSGSNLWNVTSTTFRASSVLDANNNGQTFVAYLFAHNAGGFGLTGADNVISCGSFNSTALNNLGYEPQWVMMKRTDSTSGWFMFDNMRGLTAKTGFSNDSNYLYANDTAVEATGAGIIGLDPLGFSSGQSGTYIYIAIRRGPMKVPTDATKVFEPVAFTGTNATNTTRGTTVTTDLAIISDTNNVTPQNTYNQAFYDRLRGEDASLTSSNNTAEVSGWGNTYFNLDQQFGWSNGSNTTYLNNSAINYVTYNLKRAPSFFDEVCYTVSGYAANNVAHNLTVTPELFITKPRGSTGGWTVCGSIVGSTNNYMTLNADTALQTSGGTVWGATSSTFSEPSTVANGTYVCYLFATCPGVSKVGSYTGNGTTQTINCGFTGGARFVLLKRTDATGGWYVYDTARGMTTLTDPYLFLNSTAAETATLGSVTTVSTGFALNSTILAAINVNAGTYIFLAIA